jgi:hypothetical protein
LPGGERRRRRRTNNLCQWPACPHAIFASCRLVRTLCTQRPTSTGGEQAYNLCQGRLVRTLRTRSLALRSPFGCHTTPTCPLLAPTYCQGKVTCYLPLLTSSIAMLPMSNIAMIQVVSFGLIALASVIVLGTNARDCGIFSRAGIFCPSSLGCRVACGFISCIFSVGMAAAYFFLPLDGILGTAEIGVLAFLFLWWATGVGFAWSTPYIRRTPHSDCYRSCKPNFS